ncbi:MAG TPA: ribosomal L7Ae/L30e/S12e/Gadd45 family protein [Frankiaceae bacterium]|nr:ribosomal L7Ae/L30e/S12e/Gadd45 family protein [Frankiaceae bacterium]
MAVKIRAATADGLTMAHGAKGIPPIPPGFVVGAKAVLRAVSSARGDVARVIVAKDAPSETVEPVRRSARESSLTLVEVSSSEELGRHCGLPRPVAAAAQLRGASGL